MISHTLRFSAFIAVIMLSFALVFHAVFHTCGSYINPDGCDLGDDDEFPLRDAFGGYGDSFVTVFASALGVPDFSLFEEAGSDCRCNLPQGARVVGILLMVVSREFLPVEGTLDCAWLFPCPFESYTITCQMYYKISDRMWTLPNHKKFFRVHRSRLRSSILSSHKLL